MKAIILAAGYATRLYPLTEHTPKALLPVGGKAILDHLLEKIAPESQIDEIHIVSNHRFYEDLRAWAERAQPAYAPKRLIVWDDGTDSNQNRLGAIGDIQFVLDHAHIRDDVLVAASDNLMDQPLDGFFADFRAHGKDLLLVGRISDREECKRYAIVELSKDGRVTGLEEKPEQPKTNIAAYALYLYKKDTLPLVAEYLRAGNNPDSPGHFPEWLYTQKEVRAYVYPGSCVDIGTVKMYAETCESWKA